MPEFEINGRIIQYVSAVVEADSLEEAQDIAQQSFADGTCMFGDADIEIDEE